MELHQTHRKRPGEDLFGLLFVVLSLGMLWQSYAIAGFSALSSPGAFPLAASAVMLVASLIVVVGNLRRSGELDREPVLPGKVAVFIVLVAVYALALGPIGFIPASLLFLFAGMRFLYSGGWIASAIIATGSLVVIYVLFRLVFQVVLPVGIVPESEWMAAIGNLFSSEGTK